jgi:hypothetical protein
MASVFVVLSCSKDKEVIRPTNDPFSRETNMKFYFSNENGDDLLDLSNNQFLPIAYETTMVLPDTIPADSTTSFQYNGGQIALNSTNDRFYWRNYITGKTGVTVNRIFLRLSETDTDTLDVAFSFSSVIINNVPGYYPNIDRLLYNGTVIRENESSSNAFIPANIYIQKVGEKSVITFNE